MRLKTLTFVLTTLFLASLVSAAVNFVETAGTTPSLSAGSQATTTFKLQETGIGDVSSITFTSPIIFSGCSKTFSSQVTVTGAPATLTGSDTSGVITATLTTPANQFACAYTGNIEFRGQYQTGPITAILPITLTINPSPALTVSSSEINPTTKEATITITNTGNSNFAQITMSTEASPIFPVTFSQTAFLLASGASQNVKVTLGTFDEDTLKLGTNEVRIIATANDATQTTAQGKVSLNKNYCEYPNSHSNLKLQIEDIRLKSGLGKDNDFYPFDELEVELSVKNNGEEKISNIQIEWGIYDKGNKEWIIKEEEKDFDLKKNKDITKTITFTLDENDLDIDLSEITDGDYVFYAKAVGEDAEYNDETICSGDSEDISINIEDDLVGIYDFNIPETISCKQVLDISAKVWNIGADDQEGVYITAISPGIGLDKKIEIGDIDSFENDNLEFSFEIPEDTEEKTYGITFTVYNDEKEIFETKNDKKSEITQTFAVQGGCIVPTSVDVSAVLASEQAVAGKEIIVRATIKNTAKTEKTYKLIVTNYDSWADLKSVSAESLTLGSGKSQDVTITLLPNKDSAGDREFTLQIIDGGNILSKKIGVTISQSNGIFSGITGGAIADKLKGNWALALIAIVNIILLILIIIIATKIAK